jgi:hypothetical protein
VAGVSNSPAAWREALARARVPDLNQVSEVRQYCLFQNANPEPGLIIDFSTTINKDMNHFGWPLGAGDKHFSEDSYSTRISSVSVLFDNYRITGVGGMQATPQVYLVPVGNDVMRCPRLYVGDMSRTTREWKIMDQWLPAPFKLSDSNSPLFGDLNWIPVNSLATDQQPLAQIRGHDPFWVWYAGTDDPSTDPQYKATRLVSRSVWNTRWILVIPASALLGYPNYDEGLNRFIYGGLVNGQRENGGVTDIRLRIEGYSFSGR